MKLLFNKANKNLIILYNILHRHTYNSQDNVSILKMFDLTLESDYYSRKSCYFICDYDLQQPFLTSETKEENKCLNNF